MKWKLLRFSKSQPKSRINIWMNWSILSETKEEALRLASNNPDFLFHLCCIVLVANAPFSFHCLIQHQFGRCLRQFFWNLQRIIYMEMPLSKRLVLSVCCKSKCGKLRSCTKGNRCKSLPLATVSQTYFEGKVLNRYQGPFSDYMTKVPPTMPHSNVWWPIRVIEFFTFPSFFLVLCYFLF